MRSINALLALVLAAVTAVALSACGSSSSSAGVNGATAVGSDGFQTPLTEPLSGGKRGEIGRAHV